MSWVLFRSRYRRRWTHDTSARISDRTICTVFVAQGTDYPLSDEIIAEKGTVQLPSYRSRVEMFFFCWLGLGKSMGRIVVVGRGLGRECCSTDGVRQTN